jgi:alcohol dehydrogenase
MRRTWNVLWFAELSTMQPFDFQLPTRIVFGPDKVNELGRLARQLGARRVLLVSDPGIVAAGHAPRGLQILQAAGIETLLFDRVDENPSTELVEVGAEAARRIEPDVIVGLGGGSSMDCAKGINFLYTNGGRMQDYWGVGKAQRPMLPMIAVPTTAGTGSEAQSFALITDAQTHVKMACGDKKAAFRVALLDPQLTLTQPSRVTALTGMDAIAHALETYVTKPRNAISLAFSREAWRLLAGHFPRVLDRPDDLEARGAMQWGACLAGLAIENSMLGAAHALANPLTAAYRMVHGQAIGLMLPHVVRFNAVEFGDWYRQLASVAASSVEDFSDPRDPDSVARYLDRLVAHAGLPQRLSECGVEEQKLPDLAADAARQWTGTFNPRPLDQDRLLEIYRQAY